jgi:hypothetical protein
MGRATYAIDKKLLVGQRAVSAFGGMKTSEARAKGLTNLSRNLHQPREQAKTSTSRHRKLGEVTTEELDDVTVKPGPLMQQFWGPPPTQEQYDEARRSESGASGWQARFEQSWIDKSEALVKQAEAKQVETRGRQANRGRTMRNVLGGVRVGLRAL